MKMICPIECPYDPNEVACHHKEPHIVNGGCRNQHHDCPKCVHWTEDFTKAALDFLSVEEMEI